MDSKQFINQVAAGDNAAAKDTIENILSARAFESLENYKKELAASVFTGKTETAEEPTE